MSPPTPVVSGTGPHDENGPMSERPRQVTVAGWVIMAGCVAVVVGAFEQVARLHSLDTRTSIQHDLTDGPVKRLGVSVDQMLSAMHALALVAAACATAAAILGWQVLQRSRSARLVLSILAVPLLIAGLGSASLFAFLVAGAVAMLWTPAAAAWFRGDPLGTSSTPGFPRESPEGSSGSPDLSAAATSRAEAAEPVRPAATPAPSPDARPGGVLAAAILTWVFAGLTLLALCGSLAYFVANTDDVWRTTLQREPSLADQGISEHVLLVVMSVMVAVLGLLCVAAAVVAVFVVRRAPWARVTLIVLASIAAAGLALATLASGVAGVPLVGAVVTIALLARQDAVRWFGR